MFLAPSSLNYEPIFEGGAQPQVARGEQLAESICLATILAQRVDAIRWNSSGKPPIRLRGRQQ